MNFRCRALLLTVFCTAWYSANPASAAEVIRPAGETPTWPGKPAFEHRGFYLHEGWFFKYPFAVRTWKREDFEGMFELLRCFGYDRVMIWPMLESIPAPLSEADAAALRAFRPTIEDVRKAGLECWLTQCPNLTPRAEIAAKPWMQRNPYPMWNTVRLDQPAQAEPYLAHRTRMIEILNNADGYVTIDGDPGGYAKAKPEDWLKVFQSDRAAIDRFGTDPRHQLTVPWVWAGWGMRSVWSEPIEPFTSASMKVLRDGMPNPWELLAGRSSREGWANGRINVQLADRLQLMDRSMILCYEAIEFEPSPPAAVLQFDDIRRILCQELPFAATCRGVMGNAQQPVMVLPNIYFFARGSWDPAYLNKTDEAVLSDLAGVLGGSPELLVPAWQCLRLDLERLPADLPEKLCAFRASRRGGAFHPGWAGSIP